MRILCLSKRRPQGRDLLTRPYGRFFYLPYQLAQQGHQVTHLLLSYQNDVVEHQHQYGFEWYSQSLHSVFARRALRAYIKQADYLIRERKPDWVIGFSDIWYGILAQRLAAKHGVKSLIDAYDNYESYIPWAKPLHWVWRQALRQATALTAAGPQLAKLMSCRRNESDAIVVPMAADPVFFARDRDVCRKQLGLPLGVPLIGYSGSFHRSRGMELWFQALEHLSQTCPHAKWIISGRRDPRLSIFPEFSKHVIECGYLSDEQVPLLLNSMDILLVINRPSSFGNYSYPVKLYEAMRCNIPVVAVDVPGTRWVLRDHPECLAPNKPEEFTHRIINALNWGRKVYSVDVTWEESASMLTEAFKR